MGSPFFFLCALCNLKPSACMPPPSNTTGSGASSRTQLKIYPEKVTCASVSSLRSMIGFAAASNAEVMGSNLPKKRFQFWFVKVASSNPTWVLLVFKTHNFGTGRTNDVWQLHVSRVRTRPRCCLFLKPISSERTVRMTYKGFKSPQAALSTKHFSGV